MPFLEVLESWCEAVAEERGLKPVRKHVTTMTDRLTTHLGWICEQPWVSDFDQEMPELLRTTQRITMTEPRRELLRGVMCPSCEELSLVRYVPGNWAAECRNCPSMKLDQRDFEGPVRAQARAYGSVNA